MKLTITIDTRNDAFRGDDLPREVQSILSGLNRELHTILLAGVTATDPSHSKLRFEHPVVDSNGNTVGKVKAR